MPGWSSAHTAALLAVSSVSFLALATLLRRRGEAVAPKQSIRHGDNVAEASSDQGPVAEGQLKQDGCSNDGTDVEIEAADQRLEEALGKLKSSEEEKEMLLQRMAALEEMLKLQKTQAADQCPDEALRKSEEEEEVKVNEPPSPSHSRLLFHLKDMPAVMEDTSNIVFPGRILSRAQECIVSFPGKYTSGWDALIDENAMHNQSVACVFLCTAKSGLGEHAQDPEAAEGVCYCPKIYGDREENTRHKQLGYLRLLRKETSKADEEEEKSKSEYTKAVVIREDASREELQKADEEAREACKNNGNRASWGCQWFEKWKENVDTAVKLQQKLIVVYFAGQVGKGKVDWEDLPNADLWNGIGCGGSQKCEIAYLDRQKWPYVETNAINFLRQEFQWGKDVVAWEGQEWTRGTIVHPPHLSPHSESSVEQTAQCIVRCSKTGRTFATHRVRHGDRIQKLLEAVGEHEFLAMVANLLPEGVEVVGSGAQTPILQDGEVAIVVEMKIETVHGMQKLRNDILNEHLELELNSKLLESGHGRRQLRLNKTYFCEHYESQLLRQSTLTDHQKEKFEELQSEKPRLMHVNAVAGSGKTFLAVQLVVDTLKETAGQVLFIAPSLPLCLYFIRWLGRRGSHENISFPSLLDRLVILVPTMNFMKLVVKGRSLASISDKTLCNTEYDLTVVDEAHDIFKDDVLDSGVLEKVKTKRWLLLSSLSQSSVLTPKFPPNLKEVRLTQVVRSTKRVVAGAAAFHATPADKEGLGSLCPDGPPLKTFLFQTIHVAGAEKDFVTYVQKSVAAIHFILDGYRGLSLHHRVALLVSDDDFRQKFEPMLKEALNIGKRKFDFTSFQDSMSILPLDLIGAEGSKDNDHDEVIILDTVENAKGLEQLFVICIDLDSEINYSQNDATTRARIYQALTRAQLQAVVVNQAVKGGWLEFLGLIDSQVQEFDESAALAETNGTTAFHIISQQTSKEKGKEESKEKPKEASAPLPVPAPCFEEEQDQKQQNSKHKLEVEEDARMTEARKEVAKMVSSVWDTRENHIEPATMKPRFDPRSSKAANELQEAMDSGDEAMDSGDEEADAAAAQRFRNDDIHQAAWDGDVPAMRHFLRVDPERVHEKNANGLTPLHQAAFRGHVEAVEFLLSKGAALDAKDDVGQTPLHVAVRDPRVAVAELLLSKGGAVDATDDDGRTLLHYAALGGFVANAELLLSKGAAVDAKDKDGDTPLHDAARNGHPYYSNVEAAELLLSKGATVDATNNNGQTPLDVARAKGKTKMVEFLLNLPADEASTEVKKED